MALDKSAPKTRVVQLLDLRNMLGGGGIWNDGKLTRNEKEIELGEQCYFASPYDCPMYLRFFRRLRQQKPGRKATVVEHLGTTMEAAFFTFGVTVYLKHDRPKTKGGPSKLTIIVDDSEGREVLATYETEGGS